MANSNTIIMAIALVFVIEGLLPFLAPRFWRSIFKRITDEFSDGQIRFFGLTSMIIGLLVLSLLK